MALSEVPSVPMPVSSATVEKVDRSLLTTGSRIPSLDGLRAVSVALVVAFHAVNAIVQRNEIDHGRQGHDYNGPWSFLLNGELGVSIFFVISGFLITHLLLKEFGKTGSISLTQFYIRRTFRIWPAFYAYLAVIVLARSVDFVAGHHPTFLPSIQHAIHSIVPVVQLKTGGIFAAATFTYNYVPREDSPWIGHSWSLCVEEQFYFLWPLLLLLFKPKRAVTVAIVLLVTVPLIRLGESVALPWPPKDAPASYPSLLRTRMWMMGHTRMDMLMFGCLVALLAGRAWFIEGLRTLYRFKVQWLAVAYLLASGPLWDLLTARHGGDWLRQHHVHIASVFSHIESGFRNTTEGVCIAFLMSVAVLYYQDWFGWFLNSKPLVHLGQISYSLYLWHEFFMIPQNRTWTGMFPWNLICALVMAELSRMFVENTFLAWRERWTRAHQPAALPVAA